MGGGVAAGGAFGFAVQGAEDVWVAGAGAFGKFGQGWAFVGLVLDGGFGEFLDEAVAQEADG